MLNKPVYSIDQYKKLNYQGNYGWAGCSWNCLRLCSSEILKGIPASGGGVVVVHVIIVSPQSQLDSGFFTSLDLGLGLDNN